MEKYLFIGAHPDDIEFGAGASIAKATQNRIQCHALVLSNCWESLPTKNSSPDTLIKESMNALSILGLNLQNVQFLDFPVRHFPEHRQSILQELIDLSRSSHFTRVFIPSSFDMHQDHQVVSTEATRAFKFTSLLGYELPWNNIQGNLRFCNVLDEVHVSKKKEAISSFTSQSNRFYSGTDSIEASLRFRGLEFGAKFAEAFEIIRWRDN